MAAAQQRLRTLPPAERSHDLHQPDVSPVTPPCGAAIRQPRIIAAWTPYTLDNSPSLDEPITALKQETFRVVPSEALPPIAGRQVWMSDAGATIGLLAELSQEPRESRA